MRVMAAELDWSVCSSGMHRGRPAPAPGHATCPTPRSQNDGELEIDTYTKMCDGTIHTFKTSVCKFRLALQSLSSVWPSFRLPGSRVNKASVWSCMSDVGPAKKPRVWIGGSIFRQVSAAALGDAP